MTTKAMKGWELIVVSIIVFVFVIMISQGVFAKIPEPDNIIYGIAGEAAVTVTLEVNGQFVASYTMGDNPDAGDYYILRVPMDALDPPEPGTGRTGDEARIFINDETEPAASVILSERGHIRRLDLGIIDTDGDGLPDDWEQQIIDADPNDAIAAIDDVLPGDDFDGDGESNESEHTNGTDPRDAMSTNSPANAYTAFHFEIYRAADQTGSNDFTPSFWGVELICVPKAGETVASGILIKPVATGGDANVSLDVPALGDVAEFWKEDYISIDGMMADFVPGDYWVALEADNGDPDTYRLSFKINVPSYTQSSFPDYIRVEDPLPDATHVALRPLIDLSNESWDYIEIVRKDTEEEVYFHLRDAGDDPADKHRVTVALRPKTSYFIQADQNDWGTTWLGSKAVILIETKGVVSPGIPLLLLDE